jgi:hypothetical protein
MDKSNCHGCHDDFYNQKGNATNGECWSFKSAKLIMRKEVHVDQRPPWDQKARLLPDCYHAQRYVYVEPDVTC